MEHLLLLLLLLLSQGSAAGYTLVRAVQRQHASPSTRSLAPPVARSAGDAMEDGWDRLRGKPLRRSLALWKFFTVAGWKVVRGNRSEVAEAEAARWVCDGLLRLGPTMIKLGQVFSARPDLFSPAYIEALCTLQDAVPTVSGARVKEILAEELGEGSWAFDSFDDEPIAGASLGQVHRAVYKGAPVAVKVQRRGLAELFDTDFANLRLAARAANWIERRRRPRGGGASGPPRDWLEYTDDAARLLYMEIDYEQEARNAARFQASLPRGARIRVPAVCLNATTRRVLTMEYVPSLKLTDTEALRRAGFDRKALSRRVVGAFLMQLLDTGVLHCDPHPGNMAVSPDGAQLVFYDYGMLDELAPPVRRGLRRAAAALFGGPGSPSEEEIGEAARQLVEFDGGHRLSSGRLGEYRRSRLRTACCHLTRRALLRSAQVGGGDGLYQPARRAGRPREGCALVHPLLQGCGRGTGDSRGGRERWGRAPGAGRRRHGGVPLDLHLCAPRLCLGTRRPCPCTYSPCVTYTGDGPQESHSNSHRVFSRAGRSMGLVESSTRSTTSRSTASRL